MTNEVREHARPDPHHTPVKHLTPQQRQAAHDRNAKLNAMTPQQRLIDANINLQPTRYQAVLKRLNSMPKNAIPKYIKALKGTSPTSAIKAHCHECMGYNALEIPRCTAYACPLYPYRCSNH